MSRLIYSCAVLFSAAAPLFAEDNPLAIQTMSSSGESSKLAVEMHLRATIGKPVAGHEYQFRYQLRLHTKAGEVGPLLGTTSQPNGVAFDLGPLVKPAGAGWRFNTTSAPAVSKEALEAAAKTLEYDGIVDITRKDLSGMTNLPKNAANVLIRVEPQIYDATDRKFVTALKTDAVLLFLETGQAGQVWAVRTFEEWFPQQFSYADSAKYALRLIDEVDSWQRYYPLVKGFEQVFASKQVKPEIMILAVRAVPADLVYSKSALPRLLGELEQSEDAELKSAVKAKLAESAKK
jgi:hypothetical protein